MIHIQDLTFGVEIETVGQTRDTVARAIQTVVGGTIRHTAYPSCYDPWVVEASDGRVWQVVADGSLTNVPADLRAEVVMPILRYPDLPMLQDVVRALRTVHARTDDKTGLHVHIGGESFTGKTVANLLKLVYKQEELVFAALGVSDARRLRYTKPIDPQVIARIQRSRPQTLQQLNRAWYGTYTPHPARHHASRYHIVNVNSLFVRGTIEFRAYTPGHLHAGKIKAAILFSLALCATALNRRAASARRRTYDPTSAKYDFRVFLLRLGMIGTEFKTARKHLLALMPGDSAFKHGRPAQHDPKGKASGTSI
jgi:hypothetical protein